MQGQAPEDVVKRVEQAEGSVEESHDFIASLEMF